MNKIQKTIIGVVGGLIAGGVQASPTFQAGLNSINFNAVENHYRSDASCAALGGCLAHDATNDPTGYNRVDPTSVGASSIAAGDVFAGIMYSYKVNPKGWQPTPTDEFTGYFAQEVDNVDLSGGLTNAIVNFKNPTTDPFNVLSANEMFRLYTDTSPDFTMYGTTFDTIAKATDGTAGDALWASLGLTPGGYGYTLDNLTVSGSDVSFAAKWYSAIDLVTKGSTYNAGKLNPINDISESLKGGVATSGNFLCTPADLANPGVTCNDVVGNADIKRNSGIFQGSPWYFEVNDPVYIDTIPEPATLALLGMGLVGIAGLRRRRSA